jgi:hypothetical protein
MFALMRVRRERLAFRGALWALLGAALIVAVVAATLVSIRPSVAPRIEIAPAHAPVQGGEGTVTNAAPAVVSDGVTPAATAGPGAVFTGPTKVTSNGNQGTDKSCRGHKECDASNPAVDSAP